jgi:acyl-CoA synthetase (AMP-forming)/AMP-acid ligase II/thioesterase domain-containing protein/acyl carrier protein
VSIPLNPKQTVREIDQCLTRLQPDAIVLMEGSDSAAKQVAERIGITVIEARPSKTGAIRFAAQVKAGTACNIHDEPDPEAPAFIFQTSGTAAEPKLIPFSHRNMLAAAARLQAWFDLTPQDRCLSVSPIFYSHGLKVTVFASLLTGGTVAFPTDGSRFDYSEWFSDLKPTWYSAGPTLHRLIFDHAKSIVDAKARHSLRFILSGGAPLPEDILEGLRRELDVPVVEHYGSSEAAQIAANLPPPGPSKPGTLGIPWPGTVKIVNDEGRRVPTGQRGEVWVGGPTLISGYLNAPDLNRVAFVDGWLKTGDIGSLDDEGFLTLHGRKSELINRGGEKISPTEIDEVLLRHPAIAEAAAFSVPHPRLGEDVAAAIVLRPGQTATHVELRGYLLDQLAPFKVPGRIIIRDELPKGKTGKVLRRQLSEELGNGSSLLDYSAAALLAEGSPVDGALVTQLIELWERLLQIKPIAPDDDFSEKGGDSLLAMSMLCEVEQLTNRAIPSSVLYEARTIRQLVQKLGELDIEPEAIIKLNPSGTLSPLFLFHGDYNGGGLYSVRLARALGPDQPLFAIAPPGFGNEPVPRSIEGMAADRLPLIRSVQPKGPYHLCGYCAGAIVAFEAARMLSTAGERVDMVGMIDNPSVSAHRTYQFYLSAVGKFRPLAGQITDGLVVWTWNKFEALEKALNLPFKDRWELIKSNIKELFPRNRKKTTDVESASNRVPSITTQDLAIAMSTYAPKPSNLSVVYFSAQYNSSAWRRLCSRFEAIQIGGGHAEVVRDPAKLAMIADHLKTKLCSATE